MRDCIDREGFRGVAASFLMTAVLLCSFQCTDGLEFVLGGSEKLEIKLLKEVEEPVWSVYPVSENLPSTNIYFVVRNLSSEGRVWAECPGMDLEVTVVPVCTRYTLSISATDDFDESSLVKIIAEDGERTDEMSIIIEAPRILSGEHEITIPSGESEAEVAVDANLKFFADAYSDWLAVRVSGDKVMINVSENLTGDMREAIVQVHDVYEVVTSRIIVRQNP